MKILKLLAALIFSAMMLPSAACAQDVIAGFTRWTSIGQATWSTSSKRRALIVGNTVYRAGNPDDDAPPPRLHNPASTCDDAYLIARSLVKAGWHADEIALACDQTSDALTDSLRHLTTAVTRTNEPGQVTIIYLAGHGAQVGGRPYFFGVNARPDFAAEADVLIRGDGAALLGDQASDVVAELGKLGIASPSSVLLIMDACRDDPVFSDARRLLKEKVAEKTPGVPDSMIAYMVRGMMSAPELGSSVQPEGVKIVFAGKNGVPVKDNGGAGGSRIAVAFAYYLPRDHMLYSVISDAITSIMNDTKGLAADEVQVPDSPGNLRGDPCVVVCSPSDNTTSALHADTSSPRFLRASFNSWSPPSGGLGMAGQSDAAPDRSETLLDRPVRGQISKTVEIFWCATGDAADDSRRASAFALAHAVVAGANDPGLARIGIVRATRLGLAENALAANRSNDNVIRFDPVDATLAVKLNGMAGSIALTPTSIGIEGYLPVYFCRGAYQGTPAITLYTQVPDVGSRSAASRVIADVAGQFPQIKFVRRTEVRTDNSPKRSEIRFYDPAPEQRRLAADVAAAASKVLGIHVAPNFMAGLSKQSRYDLFEFWIGKADTLKVSLATP